MTWPDTMFEYRTSFTLAAIALFAAVVFATTAHARRGRVFAPERARVEVASPEEAAQLWRARGVRGRTLVLFDRYPHEVVLPAGEESPSPTRLVKYAIFHNIVRRLVLVVPDATWREFVSRGPMFRPLREVPGSSGNALYLFTLSGVPLVAARESWLPDIAEDALVYVNEEVFDDARAAALLRRRGISSDLWVFRRKGTP